MTDSLGDTPAVARQRVRRALRAARQTTDLTQRHVAARLGWSLSKVQRIETAEVAVSETDLRALLTLYGIVTPETVETMIADTRLSRRERWWTAPELRQYLQPGLRQLLQFEAVATEIRCYQSIVIPGTLQTPAMADFIIRSWGDREPSAEEHRVRFDVRRQRRKQVIERADAPPYRLLLDESVLERKTGGAEIMAEQLEDLAESMSRPNVSIRVAPYEHGGLIAHLGSFTLMSLPGEDDQALYWERFLEDSIVLDPESISPYRTTFDHVWEKSLPENATNRIIRAKAMMLRAQLDRLQTM